MSSGAFCVPPPPLPLALTYAGLGEMNGVFCWLEKAVEERSLWIRWLAVDPVSTAFEVIHVITLFWKFWNECNSRGNEAGPSPSQTMSFQHAAIAQWHSLKQVGTLGRLGRLSTYQIERIRLRHQPPTEHNDPWTLTVG